MFHTIVTHYQTNENFYQGQNGVWTREITRAVKFATVQDAEVAFAKSMKFTKPLLFKRTYGKPQYVEVKQQ